MGLTGNVKRKVTFEFTGGTEEEISKIAATIAVLLTHGIIPVTSETTWSVTLTSEDKVH